MRTAFIHELIAQARRHQDIFLVVGDLGFSVVEAYAREFPDRFLNAGVAEQNMTGVAAGLAAEGYHVFTYSIANFSTLRCLEQIRNDVCHHRLPVTVVAVGAGLAYGNLGFSHHAIQDIGIMRTFPELTLLSPADPGETSECVRWLAEHPRPSYLRLGKAGEAQLHQVRGMAEGPLPIVRGRGDAALIATGSVLGLAIKAAAILKKAGLELGVFSCPWLQPLDETWLNSLRDLRQLFVIEEHLASGGFASLLREKLPRGLAITSFALPDSILDEIGSQTFLRRRAGLEAERIAAAITAELLSDG